MRQRFKKLLDEFSPVYIINSIIGIALILIGVIYMVTNVPSLSDPAVMEQQAEAFKIVMAQAFMITGVLQVIVPLLTFGATYGKNHKKEQQFTELQESVNILVEQNKVLMRQNNIAHNGTGEVADVSELIAEPPTKLSQQEQ